MSLITLESGRPIRGHLYVLALVHLVATTADADVCDSIPPLWDGVQAVQEHLADGWQLSHEHDNSTLVYTQRSKSGGSRSLGMLAELPVSSDEIYRVLACPGLYTEFMSNVQVSRLVDSLSDYAWIAYYEVKFPLLRKHYLLREESADCRHASVVSWELSTDRPRYPQLSYRGSTFRHNEGHWAFATSGQSTLIWYQASVDPNIPFVPRPLVRYFIRRRAPEQIDILRKRIMDLRQPGSMGDLSGCHASVTPAH